MQQEILYGVTEYARQRGVDRSSVYRWIKEGHLEAKEERGKIKVVVLEEVEDEVVEVVEPEIVEDTSALVDLLREQLTAKDEQIKALLERIENMGDTIQQQNEAIQQQNAIVMQMTRNTETTQRLLEYHEKPVWKRWFTRRKPVEEM